MGALEKHTGSLTVGSRLTFAEASDVGKVFAQSGYFKDATDVAKAITKVLAGQELGIPPMQAMTGIHIVQGKPTLSAALVGALIKRSGRYDYRVATLTDQECVLAFFERGEQVGESSFTIDEAKSAGLTANPTWKNYPRNMLLSRALTNGARWYCPDVFGGAVYTPDELGAVVDGETGEVVEPEPPTPEPRRVAAEPLMASDEQIERVETLLADLARAGMLDPKQIATAMGREYGTALPAQLTGRQADDLIGRLSAKLEQAGVAS